MALGFFVVLSIALGVWVYYLLFDNSCLTALRESAEREVRTTEAAMFQERKRADGNLEQVQSLEGILAKARKKIEELGNARRADQAGYLSKLEAADEQGRTLREELDRVTQEAEAARDEAHVLRGERDNLKTQLELIGEVMEGKPVMRLAEDTTDPADGEDFG